MAHILFIACNSAISKTLAQVFDDSFLLFLVKVEIYNYKTLTVIVLNVTFYWEMRPEFLTVHDFILFTIYTGYQKD